MNISFDESDNEDEKHSEEEYEEEEGDEGDEEEKLEEGDEEEEEEEIEEEEHVEKDEDDNGQVSYKDILEDFSIQKIISKRRGPRNIVSNNNSSLMKNLSPKIRISLKKTVKKMFSFLEARNINKLVEILLINKSYIRPVYKELSKFKSDISFDDDEKEQTQYIKQLIERLNKSKEIDEAEDKEIKHLSDPPNIEDGIYECPKCKGKKSKKYSRQTRSADEPETYFLTCIFCFHKWRIN